MITKMTRGLRAVLPLLMLAILFSACSKNDDVNPQITVGFEKVEYGIPFGGEVIVKVQSNVVADEDITLPFTVSGSLQATDYTIAEDDFVIKKGTKEAEIKVNITKNISEEDFLDIQLTSPGANVRLGNAETKLALLPSEILIYSFDKENYILTESAVITFKLATVSGSYTAPRDMVFELDLDEASTAVEGTHFDFAAENKITIPAGKSEGSITLNLTGGKPVKGKDKIVLKLKSEGGHLKPGNYYKANVSIYGSVYGQLEGSWKYKAFSNRAFMEMNTGYMDNIENLPINNSASDIIYFEEEEGIKRIKVSMTGDLGNYFRNSPTTYLKEEVEVLQELSGFPPPRANIVVLNALANVGFSKTTINERQAEIGFRVFTQGGTEILEVTIRDYEPTDFLQETYKLYKSFMSDGEYLPLKTMPLRFHFEKVK